MCLYSVYCDNVYAQSYEAFLWGKNTVVSPNPMGDVDLGSDQVSQTRLMQKQLDKLNGNKNHIEYRRL